MKMKMKIIVLGIIIGAIFIILSFIIQVPSRAISSPQRYLGGDAYNYQIEASLRAGEIAGAKATKAVYLLGGFILLFGSLFSLGFSTDSMFFDNKEKTCINKESATKADETTS